MSLNEIYQQFKQLDPEEPVKAGDIAELLNLLNIRARNEKVPPIAYSAWDDDKLIDEKVFGEWTCTPLATVQKWRVKGNGPKYVKYDNGSVRYRVGIIRKWIADNTFAHTSESDYIRAKRKEEYFRQIRKK